ncbi:hypothetical protein RF11_05584 [Thelohanellus kitauei]|uniref:Uncharacterized protein n=1 Tax=Thelohanellus kitauei TaxID=669202 RepID=A0A0C2M0G6_THEKT|nr:hypothetical protein RF11_05584 [Thelohanellus kitauei]
MWLSSLHKYEAIHFKKRSYSSHNGIFNEDFNWTIQKYSMKFNQTSHKGIRKSNEMSIPPIRQMIIENFLINLFEKIGKGYVEMLGVSKNADNSSLYFLKYGPCLYSYRTHISNHGFLVSNPDITIIKCHDPESRIYSTLYYTNQVVNELFKPMMWSEEVVLAQALEAIRVVDPGVNATKFTLDFQAISAVATTQLNTE